MTEQELRDIMGLCYPRDKDDREVLLFRVGLFPNSIDIYKNHLDWIYNRTDDWFLAEQLLPELANEIISEKKSYEYFEDFIDRGNVSSIDWTVFYEYIDTICDDRPHCRDATFIKTAEKYRKQLLDSGYDIV